MGYTKQRKLVAAAGVVLILAFGTGATSIFNAVVPFLMEGMQADLTTFMLGPTIATILSFIVSAIGVKVIDIITPKWCLLIGTICSSVTMVMIGQATTFGVWIAANVINGVVLAIATYPSAGGVLAVFYGKDTQKAFGVVGGIVAFCVAAWMAITSVALTQIDYPTLFTAYAVTMLVVGVVCNLWLIGKVPSKKEIAAAAAEKAAERAADPVAKQDAGESAAADAALTTGYTFSETFRQGPSIFCFLLAMVLVAWCASGITSYSTIFFTSFGMDAALAAGILSVYTFTAAVLKVASGFLIKKIGSLAMSVVVYLGFAIGIAFLLAWSATDIFPLAVIGIMFCAFISFSTMIPGLFIPDMYGMKDYTSINSSGMSGYYLGAITVMFFLSIVIRSVGYFNAFLVLGIISIVTMVFMLVAVATAPMRKRQRSNKRPMGDGLIHKES